MNVTTLTSVSSLLGGDTFPKCESASLRLEKFVRIGGDDTKSREIDIVTGKNPQRVPQFLPSGAVPIVAKLKERLIVDQAGGILENAGLCLHPHFNAPMIPGSAVKGVARHAAWCEWDAETDPQRKKDIAEEIACVFGYPTGDRHGLDRALAETYPEGKRPASSGKVCFLPSYPESLAPLAVDILTPHRGNDWTDPLPCAFPVVERGAKFVFAVLPLAKNEPKMDSLLKKAREWLKKALTIHGVGAKTNAGYGRFEIEGYETSEKNFKVQLHFASPAFLRGANDDEVNLRIPTLRGMLRWWWRWLYRSYLSEKDVRSLETKIWGGAGEPPTASCIALSFESTPNRLVVNAFDKRNRAQRLGWRRGPSGIMYLSYGMDEISRGIRRQRRVLEVSPGTAWTLSVGLNARRSGLSIDQLAIHARLAIWALCSFGGVGSRARKGFGSICSDISYELEDVFSDMLSSLNGLPYETLDEPTAPYAWLNSIQDSIETNESDAWRVLDRIGLALQDVASLHKHDPDKAVLGLPRQIHGPKREPMDHQRGHWHQPPQQLSANNRSVRDRFAAPLSVHLSDTPNGIRVNITAFPSDLAREQEVSEALLQECIDSIREEFEN